MTLKVVIRDDTIQIEATITDYDGETALDPDSHSIQLYDNLGATSGSAETSPTYVAAGNYTQVFDIPSDADPGRWKVRWTSTTGGKNSSEDEYFDVIA